MGIMMLSELEPRVANLEEISKDTRETLIEMRRDYHHVTQSIAKIESTMKVAVDLLGENKINQQAIQSAHTRIDKHDVEIQSLHDKITSNEWVTDLGKNGVKVVLTIVLTAIVGIVVTKSVW